MVGQHVLRELELHELAYPAKRGFGVSDQILVAHLQVVIHPLGLAARLGDPFLPLLGRLGDGLGPPFHLGEGKSDIAPVPDQVDEPGLREDRADARHLANVRRGLVAPAGLALALRVEPVEGAQDLCRARVLERADAIRQLSLVELEVRPAPMCRDRLDGNVARIVIALLQVPDQLRDEMRLGRDGQVRVSVEHQPEQSRARA